LTTQGHDGSLSADIRRKSWRKTGRSKLTSSRPADEHEPFYVRSPAGTAPDTRAQARTGGDGNGEQHGARPALGLAVAAGAH
jgi:hypothetical protein